MPADRAMVRRIGGWGWNVGADGTTLFLAREMIGRTLMLDETTPRGRLIAAALKLAAERSWQDISLIDIAEAAGLTLGDVRAHFDSKAAIIRGFVRAVDDALLKSTKRPQAGDGARDALFEVIMARLDLLAPHKPALRSIVKASDPDLAMLGTAMASQRWMLSAAGIDAGGSRGQLRTLGLASVYASVFRTWLKDDDPGLARTMAALDRRLRQGERNLKAVEGVCETATGFARKLGSLFSAAQRGPRKAQAPPRADVRPAGDSS